MDNDKLRSHIEWLRGDHENCNPWLADSIEALQAERDDYAAKLMAANDTYTEMHLALETAEAERDAAVLAEREACAALCDVVTQDHIGDIIRGIGDDIRARSNKKGERVLPPTLPAEAIEHLAGYQQADEDGVMVLVSRQAIEECLTYLRAARGV